MLHIKKIEDPFDRFPIGVKARIKITGIRPHEEGIVTAHGWSVYGNGPLLGVKVPGYLGSALLYNREAGVDWCEIITEEANK